MTIEEKLDVLEYAFYSAAEKFAASKDLVDYLAAGKEVDKILDRWLDLGGLAVEACRE